VLVFPKIKSVTEAIKLRGSSVRVGFVPTMGALHKGHLSLIERARKENDFVVASIFVNPTQFDKEADLTKYPRGLEADLAMLRSTGCDMVFTPSTEEMYAQNIQSESFDFDGLEQLMEGKHRTGHFDGVGTIVKRLFEVVKPNSAYFGEKDFQQLQIVKKLVEKNPWPIRIVGCPIFRETDGLAMSSRNLRLTKTQRAAVPLIYKTLLEVSKQFQTEEVLAIKERVTTIFDKHPVLRLDYFDIAEETSLRPVTNKDPKLTCRAFIAVFAGEIRLIDNMRL